MEKEMCGMLAFSRAGHDRDRLYMIVDQDDDSVYLCDGRLRTVDKPKKKKVKHVQIVKRISPEIRECMESGKKPDDIMIRRTIEEFKKRQD